MNQKGRFDSHWMNNGRVLHERHIIKVLREAATYGKLILNNPKTRGVGMGAIVDREANVWNCKVDKSGRIVLPQPLREAKGLNIGDELVVSFEKGSIVLRTYAEAIERLQIAFCAGLDENISLADELIAERKMEAEFEAGR